MKNVAFSDYKIFSGNAHLALAEEIASIMGKTLGKSNVAKFSDGEIQIEIQVLLALAHHVKEAGGVIADLLT